MRRNLYELGIVDDEPATRKGLVERMDWNSLGFEVTFIADDGEDAIAFLAEHHLDVLLTDIRMSVVSGLEVAEYIHRERLPVEVVLLSGYRDFEYARQAMKFGVHHYLLKPSEVEEIRRVFEGVRVALDSRDPDAVVAAEERRRVQSLLKHERRRLLLDLINGLVPTEQELLTRWLRCMLTVPSHRSPAYYVVTRVKENRREKPDAAARWSAVEEAHGQFSARDRFDSIGYLEEPNTLHLLVIFRDGSTVSSEQDGYLKLILGRHLGFDLCPEKILIAQPFCSLSDVISLTSRTIDPQGEVRAVDQERLVHEVVKSVEAGEMTRAQDLTRECLSLRVAAGTASSAAIRDAAIELCALLRSSVQRLYGVAAAAPVHYGTIVDAGSVDEVVRLTQDYACRLVQQVGVPEHRTTSGVATMARRYIRRHAHRDLTLEEVARMFYLSPVYFSRLFSKETGITFIEFLTESRMEEAARIMKDQPELGVAQVARRVGYKDPDYFSRVFRKRYGRTPSSFRRILGTRDED